MVVILLALKKKLRSHIFQSLYFIITTTAIVVFIFYISKCSLSEVFFSQEEPKLCPLQGFHSLSLRLGRLCKFKILTLFLLLHISLHFEFSMSAITLPNSSTIPNTLKKLPRNPYLDQQKQFGVISRFHHFLLESLKHYKRAPSINLWSSYYRPLSSLSQLILCYVVIPIIGPRSVYSLKS